MGKVIFITLFITLNSFSQSKIIGIVKNELGEIISAASVVAKDESNKTLAYTSTSKQGTFDLHLEISKTVILYVNAIGYEKKSIEITREYLKQNETIQIQLVKKDIEIKEVIIKNELPVKIKKDTIVFDVKAFSQGNEKVVEDLLKKIPGINVLSDGTVKIGNQEVEKIMVEGDDFFEKGYKILTKNMPSNPLDKIEVYKNHSNNKHLNGIEKSDKVALNLKLKKEFKNILFGNSDLGYGFFSKNKYDVKSNVMNFGLKNKLYFLTNINNIGSDNTEGIYNLNQATLDDFGAHSYKQLSFIQSLNLSLLNIESKRINFNNQEFFSVSDILNLSKKSKLKIVTSFNKDENYFENYSNTTAYATTNEFQNIENNFGKKNTNFIFTKLNYSLDFNKKNSLEYSLAYNSFKTHQFLDVYFNNIPLKQNLNNLNTFFNSECKYTYKISNTKVLIYNFSFNSEKLPQYYFTDSNTYQPILPVSLNSFNQNTYQKRNYYNFNINFLSKKFVKSVYKLRLGTMLFNDKLESALSNSGNNDQFNAFSNNSSLFSQNIFLNFSYNYNSDKFSLTANNEINFIKNELVNSIVSLQSNKIFSNPKLEFSYSFNEKNKIYSSHSLNNKNVELRNLYSNYIITNFRTIRMNDNSISYLKNRQHLLGYNYGTFGKKFLANALIIYNKDYNYFSNNSKVFQNYIISSTINLKNKESLMLNINLEKYLKIISSNFKVYSSISRSTYQTIFNSNESINVVSSNFDLGFEFRSGFQGPFNYHFGSNWLRNTNNSITKNTFSSNVSFLNLDFRFFKKLNLNIKGENYHFKMKNNNNFSFLDFNVDYKISKKLNLSLVVNNLFNQNFYVTQNITDLEVSTFKYKLVPRFALLKIEFRF